MYFVSCPKQGLEMEAVVLHRVVFLEYFCPKRRHPYTQTWVKYPLRALVRELSLFLRLADSHEHFSRSYSGHIIRLSDTP